jgi:hypothetical protein
MDQICLKIPTEIADQVVADGLATAALPGRSADWVGLASLALNGVATTATVIVARKDLAMVVRRILRAIKKGNHALPTFPIELTLDSHSETIVVDSSDSGLAQAEAHILVRFGVTVTEQP